MSPIDFNVAENKQIDFSTQDKVIDFTISFIVEEVEENEIS